MKPTAPAAVGAHHSVPQPHQNTTTPKHPPRSFATGLPLLLTLAVLAAPVAPAATLTVTSLADSGAGSLRAAIASAADGDTIDATGVSGTILLTSGELLVTNSVTILGPGPNNLAVDGNAASRVFHIGSNTVATISSLTITNGFVPGQASASRGAGIYNDHATLTVSNCDVTGNFTYLGAGICNDGLSGSATLNAVHTALNGNLAQDKGGGIWNFGALGSAIMTLCNCTISGNSVGSGFVGDGGGIANSGEGQPGIGAGSANATVVNCTISGNFAADSGAGIYNDGSYATANLTILSSTVSGNMVTNGNGGGIYNHGFQGTGTVSVANSTISGNSASLYGGGIENYFSALLIIVNSTFSGNSAGNEPYNNIDNNSGGVANIGSSILNAGTPGDNIENSGTFTSLGYNLSTDNGNGLLNQPTDQINPLLKIGPLQDNGGPTFTHALLLGSPAIDKGTNFSGSTTDQRGQPRTYDNPGIPNAAGGNGTDIGAFEFTPPSLAITPNSGNVVLSWPTNDPGYTVESTTVLPNPGSWTTVPGTPLVIGNQYLLGDGPVTGNKFYRLRIP